MKYVIQKKEQGHIFYVKSANYAQRMLSIEPEAKDAQHFDTEDEARKYCLSQSIVPGMNGFLIVPYHEAETDRASNDPDMSVATQYRFLLDKLKLSESTMPLQQRIQMKEAFYGAWGQCLLLQRDHITKKHEKIGVMILDLQLQECITYWSDPTQHNK